MLIYGLLIIGECISLRNLPFGKRYILTSSGIRIRIDNLRPVVGIALIAGLITLPSLGVRRPIGLALEGLMFYLIVLGVGARDAADAVAVVERADGVFVFVKRFPFASKEVRAEQISDVKVSNTAASRGLSLVINYSGAKPEHLNCERVRFSDADAIATLNRLLDALNSSRPAASPK